MHQPIVLTEPSRHIITNQQRSTSGIRAGQRLYASGLAALERQRTTASAYSKVTRPLSLRMEILHLSRECAGQCMQWGESDCDPCSGVRRLAS